MANTAAVVSYILHYDNNTKGTIELGEVKDIHDAIMKARIDLVMCAIQDGFIDEDPSELFTITKAEIVDSVQSYAGHVSSL